MLKVTLFTAYEFSNEDKALALLDLLQRTGGPFKPVRYDRAEPVRRPYPTGKPREPAALLSGSPEHEAGAIFLKGAKNHFLAFIQWARGQVSQWYFEIDDGYVRDAGQVEEFIHFMATLCETFPMIYGGAAPAEDWEAKHWLVEEDEDGDETSSKLGLELGRCLPGIYWLTVFGSQVAKHFGRARLGNLQMHRIIPLANSGVIVVLRADPFAADPARRLEHDAEIVKTLGAEYFFDIHDTARKCRAVPDLIRLDATVTENDPEEDTRSPQKKRSPSPKTPAAKKRKPTTKKPATKKS